jgi:hypothetical protein
MVPAVSRFKGGEVYVLRELEIRARLTGYRRER